MASLKPRDLFLGDWTTGNKLPTRPTGWIGVGFNASPVSTGAAEGIPIAPNAVTPGVTGAIMHAPTFFNGAWQTACSAPWYEPPTDVRVEVQGRQQIISGVPQAIDHRGMGVFARVTAGTPQFSTSFNYSATIASTGYFARLFAPVAGKFRVTLEIRSPSGIDTLATSQDFSLVLGALALTQVHGIRMDVEDQTGSSARIRVWVQGLDFTGSSATAGGAQLQQLKDTLVFPGGAGGPASSAFAVGTDWTQVLEFTATGSDFLGTNELVGWHGMPLAEFGNGSTGCTVCESFSVRSFDPAQELYREEWDKLLPTSKPTGAPILVQTKHLGSDWQYDICGIGHPITPATLSQVQAGLSVAVPGVNGWNLYQRLADDPVAQHRVGVFVPEADSRVGLWQRANVAPVTSSVGGGSGGLAQMGGNFGVLKNFQTTAEFPRDAMKVGQTWVSEDALDGGGGTNFSLLSSNGGTVNTDVDGWPILVAGQRAGTALMIDQFTSSTSTPIVQSVLDLAGDWVLTFEGTGTFLLGRDATPDTFAAGGLAAETSPGSKRIEFTYAPPTGNSPGTSYIYVGIQTSDSGDRVRNVRVFKASDEAILNTSPYRTGILNLLELGSTIRFMEAADINADDANTVTGLANKPNPANIFSWHSKGIPIETQVDICNRTGKDLWLCFHHRQGEEQAFVEWAAGYIAQNLNASLRCYVELSNEVWNNGFPQASFYESKGVALYPLVTEFEARGRAFSEQTVRVCNWFFAEWQATTADAAQRVVKVMGGWIAGLAPGDPGYDAGNPTVGGAGEFWNDLVLAWQSASSQVDGIAVAPYVPRAAQISLNQTLTAIFAEADTDKALVDNWIQGRKNQADSYGLRLLGYEGGTQFVPANSGEYQTLLDLHADARMETLLRSIYESWFTLVGDLFCTYAITPTKGANDGYFGPVRYAGQPENEAPKLRALKDAIADFGTSGTGGGGTQVIALEPVGYSLEVVSDGSSHTVQLWRRNGATHTLMASRAATGLADGTSFVLDFDVYGEGPVFLVGKIDTVAIPWQTADVQVGFVGAAGTIIDNTAERISSGPREGIVLTRTGSSAPVLSSWIQGALTTDGGGGGPVGEIPSTTFAPPAFESFGTLLVDPSWQVELGYVRPREDARMTSGRPRLVASPSRLVRQLRFSALVTRDELAALETFFDEHRGLELPFSFDPSGFLPQQPAGVWALAEASLRSSRSRSRSDLWGVAFRIVEVLSVA